ncbi:MAG TPA: nitroreductase [Pelagibacterium sp.]|uniref:nitroreductase family protein n=1 Tax=uncultured Pelagibacterium sp. TaxID=1159875 RepID=UPI000ED2EBFD|nr:nitroreductase [Pelagibacterium sp.]|tara:strand:+ start:169 stop:747 length:579 start_codon:yes stop_codon:yes gene_type:complete
MTVNTTLRDYLLSRRTVTAPFLAEPGPSPEQLTEMLTIACRVPDHGKLAPWRFVVYDGEARQHVGDRLLEIAKTKWPERDDEQLEIERKQFLPAPLTVGVISTAAPHFKIPEFEQLLAAGNVAFNLCHAANALGFGAHWVTRWFAYDPQAAAMLGAAEGERFVAFVHIGTPQTRLEERDRPDPAALTTYWHG